MSGKNFSKPGRNKRARSGQARGSRNRIELPLHYSQTQERLFSRHSTERPSNVRLSVFGDIYLLFKST